VPGDLTSPPPGNENAEREGKQITILFLPCFLASFLRFVVPMRLTNHAHALFPVSSTLMRARPWLCRVPLCQSLARIELASAKIAQGCLPPLSFCGGRVLALLRLVALFQATCRPPCLPRGSSGFALWPLCCVRGRGLSCGLRESRHAWTALWSVQKRKKAPPSLLLAHANHTPTPHTRTGGRALRLVE